MKYTEQSISKELEDKFGEYFEMAGDESPALKISLLTQMLVKERNNNEFYQRCLDQSNRNLRTCYSVLN